MSFFKKVIKTVTKPLNKLGPVGDIATAIALTAAGQPELIPLVAGAKSYGATGDIKSALLSAGGSYVGSNIGSSLGGSLGTVASNTGIGALPWSSASNAFGNSIGDFIGQSAANSLGSVSIGGALGGLYGSNIGEMFSGASNTNSGGASAASAPALFQPKREAEQEAPPFISGLGSLTDIQKSTNIANQGVFGGGNGPDEQSYFKNLINRRLVDDSGNVDADFSDLTPIDMSYLQRLGLGGHNNTRSLLEAISKWQAA